MQREAPPSLRATAERAGLSASPPEPPLEDEYDELGERVEAMPEPIWFDGIANIF